MRAVTFQSPGEVRVEEKPDPEVGSPDEAVVRVEATGSAARTSTSTTGESRSSRDLRSATSTSARSSPPATR